MKRKTTLILALFAAMLTASPSFGATIITPITDATSVAAINNPEIKALPSDMLSMSIDKFLSLTPSKYKELTGKKLGIKKSLELKAAQKLVKKEMANGSADISKGVYILLAILGFGWLAMGLMDNWEGSDWIVNLVLTILCWLPGLIHALIKMKKYYP